MPIYLGSDRVENMYLGSDAYKGYALGDDAYGAIVYSDPAIASDSASWTLITGTPTASIGADSNGVRLEQGFTGGPFSAGISITVVVGRNYEIKARLSTLSQIAAGQIFQGGVADEASAVVLSGGDTYEYIFTATSSDFELQMINFSLAAARVIYVEEVYLREVA